MGGKGGSQTSTASSAPWSGVQPSLNNYYNAGGQWFGGQGMPSYGGLPGFYSQIPGFSGYNPYQTSAGGSASPQTGGAGSTFGGGKFGSPIASATNAITNTVDAGTSSTTPLWQRFGKGSSPAGENAITNASNLGNSTTGIQTQPLPTGTTQPSPTANWMNQPMVAGLSPATQASWDLTAQRALNGSPLTNIAGGSLINTMGGANLYSDPSMRYLMNIANQGPTNPAMNMLGSTAAGGYLNANPYLNAQYGEAARNMTDQFSKSVVPSIQSMFSLAGRTPTSGNGAQADVLNTAANTLGTNLGGLAANMYGQNYATERQNQLAAQGQIGNLYSTALGQQMQAAQGLSTPYQNELNRMLTAVGYSPTLANQDYTNLAALGGVGSAQQGYQQQLMDSPYQRLLQYGQLIQPGTNFGTSTQTTPTSSNPLSSAMGGAAMGAGISAALPSLALGPWGLIGGAGLGYLSGKQ